MDTPYLNPDAVLHISGLDHATVPVRDRKPRRPVPPVRAAAIGQRVFILLCWARKPITNPIPTE